MRRTAHHKRNIKIMAHNIIIINACISKLAEDATNAATLSELGVKSNAAHAYTENMNNPEAKRQGCHEWLEAVEADLETVENCIDNCLTGYPLA